ncbi:MAG: hypothetical protein L6R36_000611 [Xanthoria steineri]|nr:MAG: hypothetical protein L6R36_000611 [Xanthoria steineri]
MNTEERQSKYAIHEAAREGKLSEVESLLNANPRLATIKDDDERLPIHWALSNTHEAIVQLLVSRKDFDPDVQDGSGWTPLMIASSLREGETMVDLLLSKDADVNIKSASRLPPSPLTTPTQPKRLTIQNPKFRLQRTAFYITDMFSSFIHLIQTALHFCASKNNLDVARKLIARKASARVKDKRGQLPLHRAAAVGSVPMVNLLLDSQSPLNATDVANYTALHHAISEGHGDTALVLLKAGAEVDKVDVDGNLAIDLAPDTKIKKFILQSAEREGIDLSAYEAIKGGGPSPPK